MKGDIELKKFFPSKRRTGGFHGKKLTKLGELLNRKGLSTHRRHQREISEEKKTDSIGEELCQRHISPLFCCMKIGSSPE